jgi:hypothetical protein
MKFLSLFFFVLVLSCSQQQKKTETIIKEDKVIVEERIKELPKKTHEELVLVIKNPNNLIDAKALIINSGLVWDHLAIDNTTLKAAVIKVPVDKKDFWIERLKTSNIFSTIEKNSATTLKLIKNIAENTFVSVRKTHCSGDCPVYDVILLKDRTIIFNGIEGVLTKGKQEFIISENKMKKLKEMFDKTSFGTYLDSYVDKSIRDYPSTFISHNNKQVEIKLWKNVPDELAFAFEAFEDILLDKKLIE